jgi:hypothetical protein
MSATLSRSSLARPRRALRLASLGLWLLPLGAPLLPVAAAAPAPAVQQAAVVELEQVPGRFVKQRLRLSPGRYVFQVKNRGVDHPVGFRLSRVESDGSIGDAVPGAALPAPVRDGAAGSSGVVELAPGRYTYRCALNPTPHYFLTVE